VGAIITRGVAKISQMVAKQSAWRNVNESGSVWQAAASAMAKKEINICLTSSARKWLSQYQRNAEENQKLKMASSIVKSVASVMAWRKAKKAAIAKISAFFNRKGSYGQRNSVKPHKLTLNGESNVAYRRVAIIIYRLLWQAKNAAA
jgi:hypothetical protein